MKLKIKYFVLSAAALLLGGCMIAANVTSPLWKEYIRQNVGVYETDFDSEGSKLAMKNGDETTQTVVLDSAVLLKNENNTLPLAENAKVNLFGYGATDKGYIHSGGGSAGTCLVDDSGAGAGGKTYFRTLQAALKQEGFDINQTLLDAFAASSSYSANLNRGVADVRNPSASFYTNALMTQAKDYSDTAIVVISRGGSESSELPTNYLELTVNEKAMFSAIKDANFAKVIVLLNTGGRMEAGFINDDYIDAAMYVGITGQSGTVSIARLLKGSYLDSDGNTINVSPKGKLADTYTFSTSQYDPTFENTFPTSSTNGEICYQESMYFGYKWYETANEEGYFDSVSNEFGTGYNGVVQFPFGYGLSYTNFSWNWKYFSKAEGDTFTDADEFVAIVEVTNTGSHVGSDVVELYSTPQYRDDEIEKASVNLIAFSKTKDLKPGESTDITLKFSAYDLASFDDYDKNSNDHFGYELDRGNYKFSLRTDAHTLKEGTKNEINTKVTKTINIDKDPVTGNEVKTRFTADTGEDVYLDLPIDGHTLMGGEIKYLSRSDFEGTFPKASPSARKNDAKAKKANAALNDEYNTTSMPTYGVDNGLYLTTVDGGSKPSGTDLDGSGKPLTANQELLLELGNNYDSPKWDDLLDQMTAPEAANLVQRGGCLVDKVTSIGKPKQPVFDGPSGFHAGDAGSQEKGEWTAFPAECLVGCCWNTETTYLLGKTQGTIAKATGVGGWYAPGLNLHRNPYSGRYFEYFSEDPTLVGHLGSEIIRAAKNMNLTCYMKHFAASEEGVNPDNVMTWLTEQTLREIYLKPFEYATKNGKANAVMTAFSCIGAVWAGACDPLNNKILRDEWGFKGSVISDYSMGRPYMNTEQAIRAGNDFMLDASGSTSPISQSNATTMTLARVASKNIIFTLCNNYATSYAYDKDGVDIPAGGELVSSVPETLQVVVNVVLGVGIVACVFFIFFPFKKKA